MEVWAAIACVSRIVQLVDFSARCISKTSEIYRSSDGVLESDSAIKDVTNRLKQLTENLASAASSSDDTGLCELCVEVGEVSNELLAALTKLDIEGTISRWKSLRKAIRSVWSKEKLTELQHKLDALRDQLNLHVSVRLRQQFESFDSEIRQRLDTTDRNTQQVLSAILNHTDVFEAKLQQQESFHETLHAESRAHVDSSHQTTSRVIQSAVDNSVIASTNQHDQTRQEIAVHFRETENRSQQNLETVTRRVESTEIEVINVIHDTHESNERARAETQAQIAELQKAIEVLKGQIDERSDELRSLLVACIETKDAKKRKRLGERSNAVTAALLALETMYESLQAVLLSLQAAAVNFFKSTSFAETWSLRKYARVLYRSSAHHDDPDGVSLPMQGHHSDLITYREGSLIDSHSSNVYFAHEVYISYFYRWITIGQNSTLIDPDAMIDRWKSDNSRPECLHSCCRAVSYEGSRIDHSPCRSSVVWLLAAATAALRLHLSNKEEAFRVLAAVFDANDSSLHDYQRHSFTMGNRSARLKTDVNYWSAFAEARGMVALESPKKFTLNDVPESQVSELEILLLWLLGTSHDVIKNWGDCTRVTYDGLAYHFSHSVHSMGLMIDILPLSAFPNLEQQSPDSIMSLVSIAGYSIDAAREPTFDRSEKASAFQKKRREDRDARFEWTVRNPLLFEL